MDKETKDYLDASFEKWVGVVAGEFNKVHEKFGEIDKRFEALESEVQETRSAVLNIEGHLKDHIEAQGDKIQNVEQRVERVEDHVGLSHSLA